MLTTLIVAGAVMTSAATPTPAGQCRRIHYAADGTVSETFVPESEADGTTVSTSARTSSQGAGSAHSSVSVSSSSHGSTSNAAGHQQSSSSSSSSSSNGMHRSVTVTRNNDGCTIVIDDRPPQGDKR